MLHSQLLFHPGAKLADDVEVGPYSIIGEHVEIGAGTVVGPHVSSAAIPASASITVFFSLVHWVKFRRTRSMRANLHG